MRILSGALTDVGLKRTGNEDAFACCDDIGLYVVADGMGGHAAGEVASNTAIQVVTDYIRGALEDAKADGQDSRENISTLEKIFVSGALLANETICGLSAENETYGGMGTTLSGMLINADHACIIHVGDSRVYLLRNRQLAPLTADHSWVNEQLQRHLITPEEARTHRWRNVITRALGHKPDIEVDTIREMLQPGDSFLLCSDGLTGMVEDADIAEVLQENWKDPQTACRKLVQMANQVGGQDNITLIILNVLEE